MKATNGSTESRDEDQTLALAREFSRLLVQAIGRKKTLKVNRLNKSEADPAICHSHDFCDANMVMLEAHQNLGIDPGQSRADVKLWNDAWNLAVERGFFLK